MKYRTVLQKMFLQIVHITEKQLIAEGNKQCRDTLDYPMGWKR